jgi:hypothetical protein
MDFRKLRVLAENGEMPPEQEDGAQVPTEPKVLDSAAQDEIRSATHAILGHTIGQNVYSSEFADDLRDLVERLAKVYDVTPTQVVEVMKGTLERWRYVTSIRLSDGGTVGLALKMDIS